MATVNKSKESALKQVLVIRDDLNMRKGKMVAQGAHASQLAIMVCAERPLFEGWFKEWMAGAFTKICVRAKDEKELLEILNAAKSAGLPAALVTDSGFTEFKGVKTHTAVGIGPAPSALIDKVTGQLGLL
ncbi:hypothetical protein A6M27_18170 [Acidithiobacillus thiooxidans]|uniref:peptidyl-tRNA hydrolase n=1 Tax=Acidithiobacillus thiooxidans TaxID=930 RepID=A0A1C2J4A1_ACITH|nr:aminoacyl-tRNA hydrolase [Acidithiobacillus thiooxidans]OCX68628.1 hypothetical protein A6P07_17935 [Acidithiobacillus thiooxidans]OCX78148.1 hypothetical protein A6O24_05155 [Acidithiobacillus thiooxidans]OCX82217.1 hypothetical protein A6O26_10525 [Acidithiobacillus thiooxidans]OCX83019.1 hypothetical protein A6M27_18170 [Acidithiobacillus thiooxidans]OFC50195.1 peptidyl-tRNA hydrolase [Acidithiobacillus thiooxidans]